MRQVIQNLRDGTNLVLDVPIPLLCRGKLLIQTRRSLVSTGTERMLIDFGRAGWVKKARQKPDRFRDVLDKVRTDGLQATVEAVRSKLDQPIPLGYSNVGTVIEVGEGVADLREGDRVVSNGPHAEFVVVNYNLCARIPDQVSDDQAAFTVLGAIGLQGVRLTNPTLGESFAVTGLGLIGLLTVQLLRTHGCRVLGIDLDESRLALARQFGAETVNGSDDDEVLDTARRFSRGRGVDGVLLTLSSKSNTPVRQAAQMCRKRGRIVLVGITGLQLNRADFYEKELSFQVSCSYGPGRYDQYYENKGHDYPIGFVRWTEQRNLEAVLDMMVEGRLDVASLITHRFTIDQATEAYDLLMSDQSRLGIILNYPDRCDSVRQVRTLTLSPSTSRPSRGKPSIAFIGAGNYAGRVLIPAFKAAGAYLRIVVTTGGIGGTHYGRKGGFHQASTDTSAVFTGNDDAVVIATRHDSHADYVVQSLAAGKHVFVEKPLALTENDLDRIQHALSQATDRILMVGFNRRFAPHTVRMKELLDSMEAPKAFIMTVNAGAIPADHWTQDPEIGGGRIVGEACHFIDLLRHLAGETIEAYDITALSDSNDSATISLRFHDGSIGTIHYLANGHKAVPKERLEVFCSGRILRLENFRTLCGFGWPGLRKMVLRRQDKGQKACVQAFLRTVKKGGKPPISRDELLEIARISIKLQP